MPNKIYHATEATKVFAASGGDAVFTPTSLANGAGRISAQLDLGAPPKAGEYRWLARARCAVAPTIGTTLRVYLVTSDGAYADGAFAATDAAIASEDALRNATLLGVVVCDAASTTKDFVRSGLLYLRARYVQVAWWNATGQALSATAADMAFSLTPVPSEVQ